MGNKIWKEKITQNYDDMKHRASLNSANVVDFLMQNGVISPRIKQDLEKLECPALQMDRLMQILIKKGESACQLFVEYLEKNSFGDGATEVEETNGSDAVEDHSEQDNDSLAISVPKLRLLSDTDKEYKNDNQNAAESVDDNNCKVEERLAKLEAGFKNHLQTLMTENIKLNEQVQRLCEEFAEFKSQKEQETADRNKLLEQLMLKNEYLRQEVERKQEAAKKFESENKDLKKQLNYMKMALALMVNSINKTEDGKRMNKKVKQKYSAVKLPPINRKKKY